MGFNFIQHVSLYATRVINNFLYRQTTIHCPNVSCPDASTNIRMMRYCIVFERVRNISKLYDVYMMKKITTVLT